jgi:predicted glycosyltransferase
VRFLVDIGHPAHVHFFRNVIADLRASGHEVRVSARDKDVTLRLLSLHGMDHTVLSRAARSRSGLYTEYLIRLFRLVRLIRTFRPDALMAIGGVFIAPAGRLGGVPSLVFTDTEHVALDRWLTYPLATRVFTPYTFLKEIGPAQRRYQGLHELAYLHPRRFSPDPEIRSALGVGPEEPYAIARFVSWGAGHDLGHSGFDGKEQEETVRRLGAHLRVFVSAEARVPPSLQPFVLRLEPHRIHHALAQAGLVIGDGATVATEAGLLGTPSLYVSSLVGTMGNFRVLQQAGLVESFPLVAPALDRAEALLTNPAEGPAWRTRARGFAEGHIDVVDFVVREATAAAGDHRRRLHRS